MVRLTKFYLFNNFFFSTCIVYERRNNDLACRLPEYLNTDANRSSCVLIFHLMHRHLPFAGVASYHRQTRLAVIIVKKTPVRATYVPPSERDERDLTRREAMQINNSRVLRWSLNGR